MATNTVAWRLKIYSAHCHLTLRFRSDRKFFGQGKSWHQNSTSFDIVCFWLTSQQISTSRVPGGTSNLFDQDSLLGISNLMFCLTFCCCNSRLPIATWTGKGLPRNLPCCHDPRVAGKVIALLTEALYIRIYRIRLYPCQMISDLCCSMSQCYLINVRGANHCV